MLWGILSGRGESGRAWRGVQLTQELSAGFFEKKQFRAYREFTATTTLRFDATKPFLLTSQSLWTGQGMARVVIYTGATQSGTFTDLPTKFGKYLLDGPVAGSTSVQVGGTATGGVEREVLRSDSSSAGGGSGNQSVLGGVRALPAGVYHIVVTVTGTTAGMYSLEWEELDPIS